MDRDPRRLREPWKDREYCGVVAAVVTSAVVGAGATVYASSKASSAAKKATNAQTAANNSALGEQQREYDLTRSDQAPWREVGKGALQQLAGQYGIQVPTGTWGGSTPLSNSPGDGKAGSATSGQPAAVPEGQDPRFGSFFASPDYQFRLSEGQRAITGNNAAKGLIDSGAMGKGLIAYSSNVASQEYGSWYNRLASLAGVGQTATNFTDAAGQANANARSGIIQNEGANRATGYATQGGIQSGLINGLGNTAAGLIKNWPTGGGGTGLPQWNMSPGESAGALEGLY